MTDAAPGSAPHDAAPSAVDNRARATTAAVATPTPDRRWLRSILVLGVVLRLVVFWFLYPINNDAHYHVVRYIAVLGRLPIANTPLQTDAGVLYISQAYHPPLYYVLAVPWDWVGGMKGVQLFSTLVSIADLWLLYRLIADPRLIAAPFVRLLCMLFAALLPQFVVFSSFISNDTLSFLVGTLIVAQSLRYVRLPTFRRLLGLAVLVGLGLLTKATLIAFVPPVFGLVLIVESRNRAGVGVWRVAAHVTTFVLLAAAVGCYKFVENEIHFGRPIVHNLDFDYAWIATQKGAWSGTWRSLFDVDVLKLVRSPRVSEATQHSYALLLYGTFWYSHIPESAWNSPAADRYVAPLIYLLGIVPTILLLIGWCRLLPPRPEDPTSTTFARLCATLLAFNLAIVVAAGVRYDVWSCFQGRMLFPSMFPILLALAAGLEWVCRRRLPVLRVLVWLDMIALFIAFVAYYAIEIARPLPGVITPR